MQFYLKFEKPATKGETRIIPPLCLVPSKRKSLLHTFVKLHCDATFVEGMPILPTLPTLPFSLSKTLPRPTITEHPPPPLGCRVSSSFVHIFCHHNRHAMSKTLLQSSLPIHQWLWRLQNNTNVKHDIVYTQPHLVPTVRIQHNRQ